MRKLNLVIIFALIFQLAVSSTVLAQQAFIRKVVITNVDDDIVVYFNLEGAFTDSIVKAISKGIPTTFTFFVRLNSMNKIWFNTSTAGIEIHRTIKYDSLTKQYTITETVRGDKETVLKKTNIFSEAKKVISEFKSIPVISSKKLKKGKKYELKIKAELDKVKLPFYLEYVLIFVSIWDFETSWYIEEFKF